MQFVLGQIIGFIESIIGFDELKALYEISFPWRSIEPIISNCL